MPTHLRRAALGGLIGTALMTGMMYFVAPTMTGQKIDIAEKLGGMMGGSWALGMIAHWMNGVAVFPLIYVVVIARVAKGPAVVRGLTWAIVLWLAAQLMVMPMVGMGVFSSQGGGMPAVMGSLIGHAMYGLALGLVVGRTGHATHGLGE